MQLYTVCDHDGVFIRIINELQRNRLLGYTEEGLAPRFGPATTRFPEGEPLLNQVMVRRNFTRRHIYVAQVPTEQVKAELDRKLGHSFPIAEDSRTIRQVNFSNENGSGHYCEHHDKHAATYPVSLAFLTDEIYRRDTRAQRLASVEKALVFVPIRPPLLLLS